MSYIEGRARTQPLLLPTTLDDYVGEDNAVRLIDAFVEGLDLSVMGFCRVEPKQTGRPGYHPAYLLKLYVYGYLNKVRSSRRLEVETHRNLEVIWLLRELRPDLKTIADFRRDNREAFRQVFRAFTILCRDIGLMGKKLIAVDGTRIKAVNNVDRNFTRAKLKRDLARCDKHIDEYLQELDRYDRQENPGPKVKEKIETAKARLEKVHKSRARLKYYEAELAASGKDQLSLTDPDALAMHSSTRTGVGYNAQIAVDAKHSLIVEQQIHSKVSDLGLLTVTADAARKTLDAKKIDVVADAGYFKLKDLAECEEAGVSPHLPPNTRGMSKASPHFLKADFEYHPDIDRYVCPGGNQMKPISRSKVGDHIEIGYANISACRLCKIKSQCTNSSFRRLRRYDREDVIERMNERVKKRPEVLKIRRCAVEHPFGTIKRWMDQGFFLMRGLKNVRGEFSLTALVYNMRRAINILGVKTLLEAVKT